MLIKNRKAPVMGCVAPRQSLSPARFALRSKQNGGASPSIQDEMRALSNPKRAQILSRFFKTGPGEYAEGDQFLGLTVPQTRSMVKKYSPMPISEVKKVLHSPIHEERLAALLILVAQFRKGDGPSQKKIYEMYLRETRYINNWDLVDVTCEHIVGAFLSNRSREVLDCLTRSKNVWERRISIVSTFHFIKSGYYEDTLRISSLLLQDRHDLIQKAVGWMLREVGKRCSEKILKDFLEKYGAVMPRTMLRYSVERLKPRDRQHFMSLRKIK